MEIASPWAQFGCAKSRCMDKEGCGLFTSPGSKLDGLSFTRIALRWK